MLAIQSGLRLSELTGLTRNDVDLGTGAHVRVIGKGRKERCTPLTKQTVAVLRAWFLEPARGDGLVVFPARGGGRLSSDGVQYLLAKHVAKAEQTCESLRSKRVSPHVLRHTTAMDLLQAGVDTTVIAMWLGHESVETTQVYLNADLEMKRKVLAKHVAKAGQTCESLRSKRVSPHVLRHTTAMDLLQAGVDTTVIAMWLGHESVETTQVYLNADLELKRKVLAKTTPAGSAPPAFRPDDALLTFLKNL